MVCGGSQKFTSKKLGRVPGFPLVHMEVFLLLVLQVVSIDVVQANILPLVFVLLCISARAYEILCFSQTFTIQ